MIFKNEFEIFFMDKCPSVLLLEAHLTFCRSLLPINLQFTIPLQTLGSFLWQKSVWNKTETRKHSWGNRSCFRDRLEHACLNRFTIIHDDELAVTTRLWITYALDYNVITSFTTFTVLHQHLTSNVYFTFGFMSATSLINERTCDLFFRLAYITRCHGNSEATEGLRFERACEVMEVSSERNRGDCE